MWQYTCSACGAVVEHVSDSQAQQLFHAHVLEAHPRVQMTVITKVGGEQ